MKKEQNILVLDTSMGACSAGLSLGSEGDIYSRTEILKRGQAERLMPMVMEVMEEAACPFDVLDAVLVTTGPGAFTGVRIALSAARGLGLSLDIPVYGITTLQALGYEVYHKHGIEGRVRVLVDTKREDYYVQDFVKGAPLGEIELAQGAQVAVDIGLCDFIAGDAAARFLSASHSESSQGMLKAVRVPDTHSMVTWLAAQGGTLKPGCNPVYLRGADVSQPKSEGRKIS